HDGQTTSRGGLPPMIIVLWQCGHWRGIAVTSLCQLKRREPFVGNEERSIRRARQRGNGPRTRRARRIDLCWTEPLSWCFDALRLVFSAALYNRPAGSRKRPLACCS